MITYDVANAGSDPLYEFLYKNIKNDIAQGILKPGEKLPSKRQFAKNLGVSVATVENAYGQLAAEGYIYSLPKSGFFVADFKSRACAKRPAVAEGPPPLTEGAGPFLADFSSNQTETELFPFTIWSKVIREVLNDSRVQLMTNSPCGGTVLLRENIVRYLKAFRNMDVQPAQGDVGAGTEYLYGLLIQLLGKGPVYAVENPGYQKLEKIYGSYGVACRWISMDGAGIRIDDLKRQGADIVHVTPSHQYPMGIVMPISRRYELLGWASEMEGRYIIEDDYDSELRLSGQPIPPLQSIDMSDKVIYMNTFTKTLCSTVRISYMVLPQKLLPLFYGKLSFYSCTVSNFEQYTLARFIEEGKFESHINRLRNYYRKKRDILLAELEASRLGKLVSLSGEEAGLHFLMEVHTGLPEALIVGRAKEKGIRLLPLSGYYYGEERKRENVYVMNYSSIDVDKAKEVMERLYDCCVE